jgi:peptide methionine sulfoxide reductase msrA/msrB
MTSARSSLTFVTVAILTAAALTACGNENKNSAGTDGPTVPIRMPTVVETIVLGMGCFWGAEKRMAALPGVVDVVSGYAGGNYEDPSYRKLFKTERLENVRNHAEVVQVTFDPKETSVRQILAGFWENHDPTQGDRQGNDVGSNYRSAIFYTSSEQRNAALTSRDVYQGVLTAAGYGKITTEIAPLQVFYPAEDNHQDYLTKNPNGYCGLGGTGVKFPNRAQSSVAR